MEELLQEIESLFLVGRHAEAVDKCRNALSDLGSVERAFFESKFKPLPAVDLNEDPQRREKFVEREKFLTLSIPLATLLIQNLYELHRQNEIASFVDSYYGGHLQAPFEVVFMSLNVKISDGELREAEKIIRDLDERYQHEYAALSEQSEEKRDSYTLMSPMQYEDLIELLVLYVLCPNKRVDEALELLQSRRQFLRPARLEDLMNAVLEGQADEPSAADAENSNKMNPILINRGDSSSALKPSLKKVSFVDAVDEVTTSPTPVSTRPRHRSMVAHLVLSPAHINYLREHRRVLMIVLLSSGLIGLLLFIRRHRGLFEPLFTPFVNVLGPLWNIFFPSTPSPSAAPASSSFMSLPERR